MMTYLAATAAALEPETVGTIIGAVILALLGGGLVGKKTGKVEGKVEGKAEGKAEALLIGPQPFMVELKQDFVTRREFEKLEGRLEIAVSDMKGLFRETMSEVKGQTSFVIKKMDGQNDRLTKKIEEVASGAYQGRQRLHNTVNDQGERLAALEATSNVANQLGKLASAISPPTKVQPTHANSHP